MRFTLSLALAAFLITQPVSVYALTTNPTASTLEDDPAPSPSPTPDQELERAKRETALAEEKQKKAEAEQAELEARRAKLKAATDPFGDPSKVAVPGGDVKTDEAGFVEVRMLSLEAARSISGRLAKALCDESRVDTLVIYDESELKAIVFSRTMVTQIGALSKELRLKSTDIDKILAATNPQKPELAKSITHPTHALTVANSSLANTSSGFLDHFLGAASVPGVAAGVISSIAQVANLFRTDTELKNKAVQIPEDMAVSYLVNELKNTKTCSSRPAFYYPHLYPTNLFADNSDSPLLKALNDLRSDQQIAVDKLKSVAARIKAIDDIAGAIDERDGLAEQRDKLQEERQAFLKIDPHCKRTKCLKLTDGLATLDGDIRSANKAIVEATNDGEQRFATEHKTWLKALKKVTAETQPLIDTAADIISKLDTGDETTHTTPLAQLLQAEKLGKILDDESTFVLRVAVSANGTTKIKKNIFIDAKIRHTAGADLVYQLFDRKGRVVMADAMQFYYDYKSASQIRDEVATHATKSEAALATMAPKSKTQKYGGR